MHYERKEGHNHRHFNVLFLPLFGFSQLSQRATRLLLSWIYSCRSRGRVNFTLPFMTNVMLSISILFTFNSWEATFHLRPPMAFLSNILNDMPGFAHHMDGLFWRQRDFPKTLPDRNTSNNTWNRHWWSYMIDTGILSIDMKCPSQECRMTFCSLTIYIDTLHRSDFTPNSDLITELDLLLN